jgi:hypothetical protein
MRRIPVAVLIFTLASPALWVGAQESSKVPKDSRLGPPKDYNGYFPWTPPKSKEAWSKRRQEVREQVLVATGLWPMPEKTPLKPVIHGKIERDGYTIEKVFFASHPGHYVTGSLYRPAGASDKKVKHPGILSPHGHWANGRFFDAGEQGAKAQIKQGAEKTTEGARYPLQARCAQLARMGCVVFHYDMVGYADSKQIGHRAGFTDPEAELRLQSFMGLQTYNSIRALDFLTSLADVDPKRIGVTGASGGGTQTFILCAIDDRPAAAFPAVMVSTAMQGGCICENCSYLRIGTGNIELAGVFAPKPLGMSGAKDWTWEIESKGLPELQALYRLLGAPDNVMAKAYLQFGHNYNQVSRELMYNFFNKHLQLNQKEPVVERPFVPVIPTELSVFDDQHPLPKDAVDVRGLRHYMSRESDKQLAGLMPNDAKSLAEYRRVLGTALRVMITDSLPSPADVEARMRASSLLLDGTAQQKIVLSRKGQNEWIPATYLLGKVSTGRLVVWVHPEGSASLREKNQLVPAAKKLLDRGSAILAVDVFRTGPVKGTKATPINSTYAGYTFGYNRPLLANRVHDILTGVAFAQGMKGVSSIDLVGFGKAGPWVALARGLCGNKVAHTAADLDQFRFENILSMNDDMMLPGALKYGGMPALTALAAPNELYLHNTRGIGDTWLRAAYKAAGKAGNLHWREDKAGDSQIVEWLLR